MININKAKLYSTGGTTWGDILGNIEEQSDLIQKINESALTPEERNLIGQISSKADKSELPDLSPYAKTTYVDSKDEGVKNWVLSKNYLTEHQDLSAYATTSYVDAKVGEIVIPDVSNFASYGYVNEKISEIDFSPYATKDEIPSLEGYAKESYVNSKSEEVENWVLSQGYLTEHQDLTGYAKETWVESQGYLTEHQPLKTINGNSLIGEGNIVIQGGEGGGLTPEQEDAVNLIVNSQSGLLNTLSAGYLETTKILRADNTLFMYRLDNKLYTYNSGNGEIGYYEGLNYTHVFRSNYNYMFPLWIDANGRFHIGIELTINPEEDTEVQGYIGGEFLYGNNNCNIFKLNNNIWMIGSNGDIYKFNEEINQFAYVKTEPLIISSIGSFYDNLISYNERVISLVAGTFYELIETDDAVTIVTIDPLFNISNYGDGSYYFYISGDWYFFDTIFMFKLNEGNWETVKQIDYYYNYFNVQVGDLIYHYHESNLKLTNFGELLKNTGWKPVKDLAVDLSSDQQIVGNKTFYNITALNLVADNINASAPQMNLNTKTVNVEGTLQAKNIKVVDVNGDKTEVALKYDLFANVGEVSPGPDFWPIVSEQLDTDNFNYYFTTHTGRTFYTNGGQFELTNGVKEQVEIFVDGQDTGQLNNFIKVTEDNTYYIDYSNIYKWDDELSKFVFVTENTTNMPAFNWWDCGDGIRCQHWGKLVGNEIITDVIEAGGVSFSEATKSVFYNGITYIFEGSTAYTYQEFNGKTVTYLSSNIRFYIESLSQIFTLNGDLYIVGNNSIYKVDVYSPDDFNRFTTEVDEIVKPNSPWQYYGVSGDKLVTISTAQGVPLIFGYCSKTTYEIPQVSWNPEEAPEGSEWVLTCKIGPWGQHKYQWVNLNN